MLLQAVQIQMLDQRTSWTKNLCFPVRVALGIIGDFDWPLIEQRLSLWALFAGGQ